MNSNGFKVNFKYDLSSFNENVKRVIADIREETGEILKKSAVVFVNAAAKQTPPDIHSYTIKKERYERAFYVLIRLVRGGYHRVHATEEDREMLKQGMVYKVVDSRTRKAVGYCKTKQELKKLRRIETRGLSKVMWGKSLSEIGLPIPIGIQRLMNKSPLLKSLPYSKTSFYKQEESQTVEVTNKASKIENFGRSAEAAGQRAVARELRWRLKAIADKERKI